MCVYFYFLCFHPSIPLSSPYPGHILYVLLMEAMMLNVQKQITAEHQVQETSNKGTVLLSNFYL